MQVTKFNICGFAANLPTFDTVEAYNEAFWANGGDRSIANPALESANRNVAYRMQHPVVRRKLIERIEAETEHRRAMKQDGEVTKGKDGEGNDIKEPRMVPTESEKDFITRVQTGESALEGSTIQSWVDEICASDVVLPDPSGRTPSDGKPKKPKKVYMDTAAKLIEAGKAALVAEKVLEAFPELEIETDDETGVPTQESLARAIQHKMEAVSIEDQLLG